MTDGRWPKEDPKRLFEPHVVPTSKDSYMGIASCADDAHTIFSNFGDPIPVLCIDLPRSEVTYCAADAVRFFGAAIADTAEHNRQLLADNEDLVKANEDYEAANVRLSTAIQKAAMALGSTDEWTDAESMIGDFEQRFEALADDMGSLRATIKEIGDEVAQIRIEESAGRF